VNDETVEMVHRLRDLEAQLRRQIEQLRQAERDREFLFNREMGRV
jgi:hypothetical protein